MNIPRNIDKVLASRVLPTALSITLLSGIVSPPVFANENTEASPVTDLTFTATSETKNAEKAAAQFTGKLSGEVSYTSDKTSASLVTTCSEKGYSLSLSEDSQSFYKDVFDKGLLSQKSEGEKLEFTTTSNGVWSFDINIKNGQGNIVDTQSVKFKVLDIAPGQTAGQSTAQAEEPSNDDSAVASQSSEDSPAVVSSTPSVTTSHSSQNMTVTYTSNGSYEFNIPTEIDLNDKKNLTVSATKLNEEANASLKIKVSSANDFHLRTGNGQNGTYALSKDGKAITNGTTVLETEKAGTSSTDLKFEINPGNFMVADTYNDTLTFTAQNGYAAGTVLSIGGEKFIVMNQTDNDTYELIAAKNVQNIQWQANQDKNGDYYNIGIYDENDAPETRHDGQNSNTYEDSYVDKWCENTYFKQLPEELQKAIVPTQIKQVSWEFSAKDYWSYRKSDTSSDYCWMYNEGTKADPKWVNYDQAKIREGESGIYPYSLAKKYDTGYNGQQFDTITRHVYLPSVEELTGLIDLETASKVYDFLKGSDGDALAHMWTRDSYRWSSRNAVDLNYFYRSLCNFTVSYPWYGVRPAFTVDLSAIKDVTVCDAVHYR